MTSCTHRESFLDRYKDEAVPNLINRKLLIHKQLERPSRSYVVYTDLHGSYEKFLFWMKNGLGYYRIVIRKILGASYSEEICEHYEKLFLLVNRTRIKAIEKIIADGDKATDGYHSKAFFTEKISKKFIATLKDIEKFGLSKQCIFEDLLVLLRKITKEDEHRIIKVVPPEYLENTLKLFFKKDRPSYESLIQGIVGNEQVFNITASLIVKLILINVYDKHINLGDTFDRGNDADKLVQLYKIYFSSKTNSAPLHYIWGNHDILWMGASIGNPILGITALRVSLRYNNTDFLDRYGFCLNKLRDYALKTYKEVPTGVYLKGKEFGKYSREDAIKMTKVLLILEAKLTVIYLKDTMVTPGDIDYKGPHAYYYRLLKMLPTGIKEDPAIWKEYQKKNPLFSDVYFPTIDPECPEKLTKEEEQIAADLTRQFTTLPKLQDDMRWLFENGEAYRVVDNTLYYHGALPATDDMELASIKGNKGKALLDYLQQDLRRIAKSMRSGKQMNLREKMLLWYLWCGKYSPVFCKSKMATLERGVFNQKEASKDPITTWTETSNPYYKHIRNDVFLSKILAEFHADKLCMGHTPVKSVEQGILSQNLGAFIIDGGASDAYGDRGAVLINTPEFTYLTLHPPLNELKKAEEEDRLPNVEIIPLEEMKTLKIRHMDKGYFLKKELSVINELLETKLDGLCDQYFY